MAVCEVAPLAHNLDDFVGAETFERDRQRLIGELHRVVDADHGHGAKPGTRYSSQR